MKKSDIEKIKTAGMREVILRKINSLLFDIKIASEDASKEYCKNLTKEIAKMQSTITDILDLWSEVKL